MFNKMLVFWVILLFYPIRTTKSFVSPTIGIIGGGIGGTSCAYFLNELFGEDASIKLFERDLVGGRLALLDVDGNSYEAGGSVIHPRNKYMKDFANMFGIKRRMTSEGKWGIYDGENFVFKDSDWTIVTLAKLIWRYGWDIFSLNSLISSLLADFNKIYEAQDNGQAFMTVSNLLHHMNPGFPNMTQQTLQAFLKKRGCSSRFLKEFAQAVMLVNYGQTIDINAFVGSVSLAGAESGLWSMRDGNKQVPLHLLEKSNAKFAHAEITSIILLEDGTFRVIYQEQERQRSENFDILVISAPLIRGANSIKFVNFTKDMTKYEGRYHRTVSTFVQGKLKNVFHSDSLPSVILTNNDSLVFNSIGLTLPVNHIDMKSHRSVYKLFSKTPLTKEQLSSMFTDIGLVNHKDWYAYPEYSVPEDIPPFMLYPGLYYTNAIEWAASAMEMSAISGRNAALLIYNTWNSRMELIDAAQRMYREEL